MSGLILTDDFAGISETPEELQKQLFNREGARIHWGRRVTAHVNGRAVCLCNKEKVNPVHFSRKWGEDELPIVDQYTYLGVDTKQKRSWGKRVAKTI